MSDDAHLLLALQHADSFFPSGAMAFSWSLEGLRNDGIVAGAVDVHGFVETQLRFRWATCDRAFLVAAYRAGRDCAALARLDGHLTAMTLPREMREGAARAGAALLGVHARLGTEGAGSYRAMVRAGHAPGNLPVIQGMLLRAVGLSEAAAQVLGAYGCILGGLSAALRLSLIDHVAAQAALGRLRAVAADILAHSPPRIEEASMFVPMAEVASARHEIQEVRLFAN